LTFVNYIVFEVGFTVHVGKSINEVPISWAQTEEVIAVRKTYVGNFIRNFPFEDNESLIVTLNVYEVILLTISVPREVKEPVRVVAAAVNDWYPTCIG